MYIYGKKRVYFSNKMCIFGFDKSISYDKSKNKIQQKIHFQNNYLASFIIFVAIFFSFFDTLGWLPFFQHCFALFQ